VVEIQTLNDERNGGASDACKIRMTTPTAARMGKLVERQNVSTSTKLESFVPVIRL
jgi:hypothetical protein